MNLKKLLCFMKEWADFSKGVHDAQLHHEQHHCTVFVFLILVVTLKAAYFVNDFALKSSPKIRYVR